MFGDSGLRLPELPFGSAARGNPVVISPQWHALRTIPGTAGYIYKNCSTVPRFPSIAPLYALLP